MRPNMASASDRNCAVPNAIAAAGRPQYLDGIHAGCLARRICCCSPPLRRGGSRHLFAMYQGVLNCVNRRGAVRQSTGNLRFEASMRPVIFRSSLPFYGKPAACNNNVTILVVFKTGQHMVSGANSSRQQGNQCGNHSYASSSNAKPACATRQRGHIDGRMIVASTVDCHCSGLHFCRRFQQPEDADSISVLNSIITLLADVGTDGSPLINPLSCADGLIATTFNRSAAQHEDCRNAGYKAVDYKPTIIR